MCHYFGVLIWVIGKAVICNISLNNCVCLAIIRVTLRVHNIFIFKWAVDFTLGAPITLVCFGYILTFLAPLIYFDLLTICFWQFYFIIIYPIRVFHKFFVQKHFKPSIPHASRIVFKNWSLVELLHQIIWEVNILAKLYRKFSILIHLGF